MREIGATECRNSKLTQQDADELLALEKQRANEDRHVFPIGGEALIVPLDQLTSASNSCST